MSDTKLRMLKFIVLHNGITPEKLADLLRFSKDKSLLYLTQLHDDGIIIKKETIYDVNPIIYRQVIDQLYLMNILH
jgi:predicted transcriptional regulator